MVCWRHPRVGTPPPPALHRQILDPPLYNLNLKMQVKLVRMDNLVLEEQIVKTRQKNTQF